MFNIKKDKMKKQVTKTILGLIIAVFTFCCVQAQSVSVWDGTSAIWTQGSGTETDPYLIQSAQNLAWIADMVNSGITTYSGVWFRLTTDLDMNDIAWEPIGHNYSFCGKFDGDNHSIDNIKITNNYENCGLWGKTGDGLVVKNLHVQINITQTNNNIAGAVIGNALGDNMIIQNCRCTGIVRAKQIAGGIVGKIDCGSNAIIRYCCNLSEVKTNSGNNIGTGGIVGKTSGGVISLINCINNGTIMATYSGQASHGPADTTNSGGIIGVLYAGMVNLVGCVNTGNVASSCSFHSYQTNFAVSIITYAFSGGIIGCANSGFSINKCFNTGIISANAHSSVDPNNTFQCTIKSYAYSGGIVGQYQKGSNGIICNSYNTGNVTKSCQTSGNSSGIFAYSSKPATIRNCYNVGTCNVGVSTEAQSYVHDSYYLNTSSSGGAGTSTSQSLMSSPSFPDILNTDSIVFAHNANFNQGYPILSNLMYLKTDTATNIYFTQAKLNGIYAGPADVVGFQYKDNTNSNYTTVYTNVGSPAEYQLTGLQSGTSYSYRFFVQKDGFTYYGNELSFITLACDLQASISESVTEMCNGEIATFTASCSSAHSNMFTYQWNNSEEGNIIQVNDGTPYTVTVQDTNGCTTTASASVVILPLPQGVISGNTTLCPGESTVLTASGANRYNWSTGASSPTITVNTSGTYTCTFTNSYNCSMTQSVEVSVLDAPTISGELNICEGGSTTLTASGGASYVWNNGASTPSITVNNAGIYTVTATSGNCSATASVTTAIIPIPQVTISGNPIICSGVSTTLTASSGSSYLWSTGETTPSISVNNPGTYSVTVTNINGCSSSASQTVSLMEPTSISGDSQICSGESTTLSATGTGSYQWSNGANTPFITVNTPGTYSVTVSLPNGCSSSAAIEVTAASSPTPSISGNNVICEGQSTTLTATGGNNYSWNNGSTQNSIVVTQSGNYTVTVTNTDGCSASTSTTVTVNPLPNVTISGSSSFCQGGSTTLTASGANTYLWSNASTNAAITINNAGIYTVTGTDINGCTNTASQTVAVNPTYNIPLTHSICEGESYNFYGQNLTSAGTYTHTLQTINGCDSVLILTLTVKTLPTASITGNTTICEGQSTTLTATGGNSYSWSTGSTNSSISVNQSGLYTVTATNTDGCSASTSTTVTVNPLPTITISGNTTVCQGSSTTLTASGADSYSWSTGENTASVSISSFGVYTVTGTSAEGCSSTADVTVLVSQLPVITISGEADFCAGGSTTLTANGGTSYLWSDGTTDASITVNTAGTYQVIGYNTAGCNSMESVTVNQWQPASSEFTITTDEDCYEWNGQSYCQTGDYTQTFQTIHGCDSVVILHLTIETGIDNYAMNANMNIYPNPTSDVVNVQLTMNNEQLGNVTIQVYDVFGKMLDMVNVGNSDAMNRVPTGYQTTLIVCRVHRFREKGPICRRRWC